MVVLAMATLALSVSLFLMFNDGILLRKTDRSMRPPVGKAVERTNDVRRRIDGGLAWSSIAQDDTVYEGDAIFTGDESRAVIRIGATGELVLDPRSLVVISTQDAKPEIDLKYGTLVGKVEKNTPILISQDGEQKELSAQNAEVKITKKKGADARIRVVKGEIQLQSKPRLEAVAKNKSSDAIKTQAPPPAPVQVVKKDEVVVIKASAASEVAKGDILLEGPADRSSNWFEDGKAIHFSWQPTGATPKNGFVIEFSTDAAFKHTLREGEVNETSIGVRSSPDMVGNIYWRVRSKSGKDIVSLPALVRLYADVPPELVSPATNETQSFDFAAGEKTKNVKLTWQDRAGSNSFQVEVAEDEEFTKVFFRRTLSEFAVEVPSLPEGLYHWRVLGQNPARKTPRWSEARNFRVKASGVPPPTPEILSKLATYEIPEKLIERLPASIPESGGGIRPDKTNLVELKPLAEAVAYEIEVSRSPDFAQAKTETSQSPSFSPSEVRPGLSYIRVKAKSADGLLSPPSAATQLEVLVPPPNLDRLEPVKKTYSNLEAFKTATETIPLKWSARPWAAGYELEFSPDRDFARKKSMNVAEPKKDLALQNPGTYVYRVRALASDGRPISRFSQAQTIAFAKEYKAPPTPTPTPTPIPVVVKPPTPPPAIPGPQLIEPQPETRVIAMAGAPSYVTFRWQEVPAATTYRLQVSRDRNFTQIIGDMRVNSTKFVYESRMPSGSLFWRVRAEGTVAKPNQSRGVAGENASPLSRPSDWSDAREINVRSIP
jgi:hypothetical protein